MNGRVSINSSFIEAVVIFVEVAFAVVEVVVGVVGAFVKLLINLEFLKRSAWTRTNYCN